MDTSNTEVIRNCDKYYLYNFCYDKENFEYNRCHLCEENAEYANAMSELDS